MARTSFEHDAARRPSLSFASTRRFGGFLAQLQPQLPLKPIDTRRIHAPAFPSQQHMDTPIAVAHPRLGNLMHPFLQVGLIRSASTIMVARPFRPKHAARPSDADDPGASKIIDELPAPIRCQNFRLTASCNIALSSDKSATNGLRFAFSSSSYRSRRIYDPNSAGFRAHSSKYRGDRGDRQEPLL